MVELDKNEVTAQAMEMLENGEVNSYNEPQENQGTKQVYTTRDINERIKAILFVFVGVLVIICLCTASYAINKSVYDKQNTYISELNLKLYDTKAQQECVRDLGLLSVTDLTIGQYIAHDISKEEQDKLLEFISLGRVSYFNGITYLDKNGDEYKLLKMNTRVSTIIE